MAEPALSSVPKPIARPPEPAARPEDLEPEPFGQAGVRQYFGPIVRWIFVVCFAVAVTFWHRSHSIFDELRLRQPNQDVSIRSVHGYVQVHLAYYKDRQPPGYNGWVPRTFPANRVPDRWVDGPLKMLGFQFSFSPPDARAASGFWLRVKWYFAAALFAAVPVAGAVVRWRRKRAPEGEQPT